MSTHTHDNLCDWQPCATCARLSRNEQDYAEDLKRRRCCSECDDADLRDGTIQIPTFADAWQQAPGVVRRLITEADAEYWWLKGQQAGRIAEQVETREWLAQMVEGYGERAGR